MPYDRTDPAAWWKDAEPLPPKPDGPGEWEITATPYGWEWKRADSGAVVPGDANVRIAVFAPGGSVLEPAAVLPDADTAGILAAGHRALDRIAARAEAPPKDARLAALERVADAARDATNPPLGDLAGSYVRLCSALRALAALDGEAAP